MKETKKSGKSIYEITIKIFLKMKEEREDGVEEIFQNMRTNNQKNNQETIIEKVSGKV